MKDVLPLRWPQSHSLTHTAVSLPITARHFWALPTSEHCGDGASCNLHYDSSALHDAQIEWIYVSQRIKCGRVLHNFVQSNVTTLSKKRIQLKTMQWGWCAYTIIPTAFVLTHTCHERERLFNLRPVSGLTVDGIHIVALHVQNCDSAQ